MKIDEIKKIYTKEYLKVLSLNPEFDYKDNTALENLYKIGITEEEFYILVKNYLSSNSVFYAGKKYKAEFLEEFRLKQQVVERNSANQPKSTIKNYNNQQDKYAEGMDEWQVTKYIEMKNKGTYDDPSHEAVYKRAVILKGRSDELTGE